MMNSWKKKFDKVQIYVSHIIFCVWLCLSIVVKCRNPLNTDWAKTQKPELFTQHTKWFGFFCLVLLVLFYLYSCVVWPWNIFTHLFGYHDCKLYGAPNHLPNIIINLNATKEPKYLAIQEAKERNENKKENAKPADEKFDFLERLKDINLDWFESN